MKLTSPVAKIITRKAEYQAASMAIPMAIAVADQYGALIHFTFMDGTLPASREIAVSKAYTAAILRMSTRQLGELSQPGAALYGIQETHGGKLVLFGGGFPLCIGEQVVGSIGVSGGSVEEDEQVAAPAVETFTTMVNCARMVAPLLPDTAVTLPDFYRLEHSIKAKLDNVDAELAGLISGAMQLAMSER